MLPLRTAEWIYLAVFAWLAALGLWRRQLGRMRRTRIAGIGGAGIAILAFASQALPRVTAPFAASVSRDWIPILLMTLFYWQAGQFVTGSNRDLEARLERLDRAVVVPALTWCARRPAGRWILTYTELSYLAYYLVMPLSVVTLYLLHRGAEADRFWTVVLLASCWSYLLIPFLPLRPPRSLGEKWEVPLPSGRVRALNEWILNRGSIHANTFPSAHVAIATGCALSMLGIGPLWVGLGFGAIAISIALGAVAGRYHYLADAILGFAAALLAFGVEVALAS
jgi:hypothetical protein